MNIGPRFAHTGPIHYQYGIGHYHYRMIGKSVYRFGRFTYTIDGRVNITREKV